MKELIPSFLSPRSSPEVTFKKFGLRPRGILLGTYAEPNIAELGEAARFRNALEELGGLYTAFGQFLCWRADLLRTDYLGRLRQIKPIITPIAASDVGRELSNELGAEGAKLAERLEREPCWNTLARCAYRTHYQGRAIVAQVTRDPIPDGAFESFETGIKLLGVERLEEIKQASVLAAFREWMRLSDSPSRERSYLAALAVVGDKSLTQYPVLIGEISTEKVLCFEWIEGETVASCIAHGSPDAVKRVAEYVLEQFCMTAAVDGDFDPESMVLTPSGRLGVRRANRLLAIPPALTHSSLKYVSAVLASNAPVAAQLLAKLASGRSNMNLETRLLDELSNLEPELKVNLQFPPSAAVFEGNWRALQRAGGERTLFLDIMHRNLIAAGYWNAETAALPNPAADFIAEAQWPVIGRILRTRLGEMVSRETASDWFLGSGLLFFEALRQMNRLAEGLRENDISLGVDLQPDENSGKAHQRIRSGILIGMVVIVFLVSLRFAVSVEKPWSTVLSGVALVAGFALFWFVSRFD